MAEEAQMSEGAKTFWKVVGLILLVLLIGWLLNLIPAGGVIALVLIALWWVAVIFGRFHEQAPPFLKSMSKWTLGSPYYAAAVTVMLILSSAFAIHLWKSDIKEAKEKERNAIITAEKAAKEKEKKLLAEKKAAEARKEALEMAASAFNSKDYNTAMHQYERASKLGELNPNQKQNFSEAAYEVVVGGLDENLDTDRSIKLLKIAIKNCSDEKKADAQKRLTKLVTGAAREKLASAQKSVREAMKSAKAGDYGKARDMCLNAIADIEESIDEAPNLKNAKAALAKANSNCERIAKMQEKADEKKRIQQERQELLEKIRGKKDTESFVIKGNQATWKVTADCEWIDIIGPFEEAQKVFRAFPSLRQIRLIGTGEYLDKFANKKKVTTLKWTLRRGPTLKLNMDNIVYKTKRPGTYIYRMFRPWLKRGCSYTAD